jgi:hypothetical protein
MRLGDRTFQIDSAPHCLKCGGLVDGATEIGPKGEETGPGAGDLTVCCHCLAFLVFLPGLNLRELTDAEIQGLRPDELSALHIARAAVVAARLRRIR